MPGPSGSSTSSPHSVLGAARQGWPGAAVPWSWGVLAGVLVLGGVLSVLLVLGGRLLGGALLVLEDHGVVPRHALAKVLAGWGIGEHSFLLALSGSAIYGAFLLAVWLLVGRGSRGGWRTLGLGPISPAAIALVLPVYLATLFVSGAATALEAALLLHGRFSNPQTALLAGDSARTIGSFLVLFVMVSLLGPVVEELLFRGMFYQLLRGSLPVWAATCVSALLFALAHGIAILVPALFIFGVALALLFEYTRSLYASIMLHVVINTVALVGSLLGR